LSATAAETEQLNPTAQPAAQKTAHDEFQTFLDANGFTLDMLLKFGAETGNIENSDTVTQLSEIKAETLSRLLRNRKGLLAGLRQAKCQQ
jgi:hypothetical protein